MKLSHFISFAGISVFGLSLASAEAAELSTAQLKAGIAQANVTLPQMVDEETRLDRIEAGAGEAVYFYTLINYSYAQLNWDIVKQGVLQGAVANYCDGAQMAAFREANVDMLYIYYDKDGEMAGTVKIPHTVCPQ